MSLCVFINDQKQEYEMKKQNIFYIDQYEGNIYLMPKQAIISAENIRNIIKTIVLMHANQMGI